jgi:hypothetical protein
MWIWSMFSIWRFLVERAVVLSAGVLMILTFVLRVDLSVEVRPDALQRE